jgi:hypothetical protein
MFDENENQTVGEKNKEWARAAENPARVYFADAVSSQSLNQRLGYAFGSIGIFSTEKGFGRFWELVFRQCAEIFRTISSSLKS